MALIERITLLISALSTPPARPFDPSVPAWRASSRATSRLVYLARAWTVIAAAAACLALTAATSRTSYGLPPPKHRAVRSRTPLLRHSRSAPIDMLGPRVFRRPDARIRRCRQVLPTVSETTRYGARKVDPIASLRRGAVRQDRSCSACEVGGPALFYLPESPDRDCDEP